MIAPGPAPRPNMGTPWAPHDLPLRGLRSTPAKTPVKTKATILKVPKPKAPVKPPPKPPAAALGPQVPTVQQMVNAQVNPVLAQIQQQQAALDAQHGQQLQAIQTATNQFLAYLQGGDKSVQADYTNAANQVSGFAQAGAGMLAAANPNDAAQANLQAIGAPASQQAQVAQQNQNVFQGGAAALYGAAGMLPAQRMAEQGAAAAAYQKTLPATVAAQGLQNLNRFSYQSHLDNQQLANQRADIIAKIPGLTMDAQNSLNDYLFKQQTFKAQQQATQWDRQFRVQQAGQTNAARNRQLALEGASLGVRASQGQQRLNQGQQRLNQTNRRIANQQAQFIANYNKNIAQFNARQKTAQTKQALPNSGLSGRLGYLADSAGNPILKRNGNLYVLPGFSVRNGQIVKIGGSGKNAGGFSASKLVAYRAAAEQLASDMYTGGIDSKGVNHPPLLWQAAIAELRRHNIPFAIGMKVLGRYYKPGTRGRPYSYDVNPRTNPKALGPPAP